MQLIILFFTTLAALIPIQFIGKPIAKSTIADKGTTLFVNTGNNRQSGAQFPYVKKITDSQRAGLVTVYLDANRTHVASLQTGFDPISQTCSCYWLDAKELLSKFPTLKTRSDYRISMVGPKFRASSGKFKIDTGKKQVSSKKKSRR